MIIRNKDLIQKENVKKYVSQENSFINIDVSVIILQKGEKYEILPSLKENAIDLLEGEIEVELLNKDSCEKVVFKRRNIFHEKPSALITDRFGRINIVSKKDNSQILLISTINNKSYGYRIFKPEDISILTTKTINNDTSTKRKIIEFFSYQTLPESKMVLGEVIGRPGNWSSWPPHNHYQPEMYLFRFNKPQGFGVSFVGNECYMVNDWDAVCIPGRKYHPVVSAPGYIMWYAWIIPNIENKPWVERKYCESHKWTLSENIEESKME